MKPYLITIIILSFISTILGGLIFINIKSSQKDETGETVETLYMNELMKASVENECYELMDPMVYAGNNVENTFRLFDLVNEECLVFRFSGEACNVCIDFVLEKIKGRFENFAENDRILLIGSNINPRVKDNYYGKKILSYSSENMGIPFEEYNIPFLFVIDRDRITKLVFIPEKAVPELTDFYLDTVKKRYFSGN